MTSQRNEPENNAETEDQAEDPNYWKQRYLEEHEELVAIQEMFTEIQSEFQGQQRKGSMGTAKLVLSVVTALCAAIMDIQEVVKARKPSILFKVTKWSVILILGFFSIWQISSNEALRDWIGQNFLAIGILAFALVAFAIFLYQRMEK